MENGRLEGLVDELLTRKNLFRTAAAYQVYFILGLLVCWAPQDGVIRDIFFTYAPLFEILCIGIFLIGFCLLLGTGDSRKRIGLPYALAVFLCVAALFALREPGMKYLTGLNRCLWPVGSYWRGEVLSLAVFALLGKEKAGLDGRRARDHDHDPDH